MAPFGKFIHFRFNPLFLRRNYSFRSHLLPSSFPRNDVVVVVVADDPQKFLHFVRDHCKLGFPVSIFHQLFSLQPRPSIIVFCQLFTPMSKIKPNPPFSTILTFSNLLVLSGLRPNNYSVGILSNCYCRLGRVDFAFSLLGKIKATAKFRAIEQQVNLALQNSPQPGPAVFIAHCLYALPLFDSYADGFRHLIVSALLKFLKGYTNNVDLREAQDLAAQLFLDVVDGFVLHDDRILIKIIQVFNVKLANFERAQRGLGSKKMSFEEAEAFVEMYILRQIESQSYMTAVSLLEQFGIRHSGESLLAKMIEANDFNAAEKWASYMGKSMLCDLIEEYVKMNMLKGAYGIIKRNNLQEEFPDVYHKCKESALKTLAEKGCWDVAEGKAKNDRQLLEYLVYLAMEAGYTEMVDELCDRYSLEGCVKAKESEVHFRESRFLHLNELLIDEIFWVDTADSLQAATSYIEGCKVVGLDCEWKPNYIKGSKPNKVSIIQIASEKVAFVFDLIKLHDEVPEVLNNCMARIFQSPRILKLGYNFQCDMRQLSRSYQKLDCFKCYEILLDIQKVFKEPCDGLSGLVKKILGAGLNKTRRNSNWEQRPLTRQQVGFYLSSFSSFIKHFDERRMCLTLIMVVNQQLEYAAMDAVVLVHIFQHMRNHPQPAGATGSGVKMEWKSHIVSVRNKPNHCLSKAVCEIWSFNWIQALRRPRKLVTSTSHGEKKSKARRNIQLIRGTRNLAKLLETRSSIFLFQKTCTYNLGFVHG